MGRTRRFGARLRRAPFPERAFAYYDLAVARTAARAPRVEQLSVGFDIDPIPIGPEPPSDTMRQIVSIRMPDAREIVIVYYENLFGLLFFTKLEPAGNRFRMTGRKHLPLIHPIPDAVRSELPRHWWRRGG